ncbi:hypothetical protein KGA66_22550 [Actinocrinis puniceicyclus]|uniref:Succinate dehydrogenase membrane anchor subunit n=1 Tax=Actinocrinis puniceicyclus TaxID=977794 RepID=A0A8J7WTG0_9ACTN|nr:hypothetical protein [Actinocrinis puniceicyclus]MBS2965849.1 hypothetical protein [Actinocrinis puniceicyclus]
MSTGTLSPGRAKIDKPTLRTDRYWVSPLITFLVFTAFIAYATFRAFQNDHYYASPYISPFYSPCISDNCVPMPGAGEVHFIGSWWGWSPALLVLVVPLGFRMTCYYYRKAYYRSFWQSPPACAVAEPHRSYTGETRFPLIFQNSHRYFFVLATIFNVILTWDAILGFRNPAGQWGHMGVGTLVLLINAALLWLYTASCHSCRHIMGGRLKHFSKHPIRYRAWGFVSKLNGKHMQLAWVSLFGVALADLYVLLLSLNAFTDPRFF